MLKDRRKHNSAVFFHRCERRHTPLGLIRIEWLSKDETLPLLEFNKLINSPSILHHNSKKRGLSQTKNLMSRLSSALLLCTLAYTTMGNVPHENPSLYKMNILEDSTAHGLGKTLEYFKNTYPDIYITHDALGNRMTHFPFQGDYYYIWFVPDNNQEIAFRIKIDRSYSHHVTDEITENFIQNYGAPIERKCNEQTLPSQRCHYKWQTEKALSFDLYSNFDDDKVFQISSIVTDTVLATKYHQSIDALLPPQWQFSLGLK
jgi:hypothetical protein